MNCLVVNVLELLFFLFVVVSGLVYYFKSFNQPSLSGDMNLTKVNSFKIADEFSIELINIAHRRARVDDISDMSSKVMEIKLIDDELIRISKMIHKLQITRVG